MYVDGYMMRKRGVRKMELNQVRSGRMFQKTFFALCVW